MMRCNHRYCDCRDTHRILPCLPGTILQLSYCVKEEVDRVWLDELGPRRTQLWDYLQQRLGKHLLLGYRKVDHSWYASYVVPLSCPPMEFNLHAALALRQETP